MCCQHESWWRLRDRLGWGPKFRQWKFADSHDSRWYIPGIYPKQADVIVAVPSHKWLVSMGGSWWSPSRWNPHSSWYPLAKCVNQKKEKKKILVKFGKCPCSFQCFPIFLYIFSGGMRQTNSRTLAAKGLGTLHLGVGAGQKLCKGGRTGGICLS